MCKCHCSGISFEKVAETARSRNCDYREVIREFQVADTCTACKPDLIRYCETELGQNFAG